MKMKNIRCQIAVFSAKIAYLILRASGRNAGSFPGVVALKIFPDLLRFVSHDADITLVTGTNGKTTTTKMIVEIMKAAGMQVVCNSDGANMLQGIATRVALNCDWRCRLRNKYLVLECDELHFVNACRDMRPRRVLIKDICKDQTDRLGSPENVEKMIAEGVRLTDGAREFRQKEDSALCPYHVLTDTEDHIAFEVSTPGGSLKVNLGIPGIYNVANAIDAICVTQHLGITGDIIKQALARMTPSDGRQHSYMVGDVRMRMILVKNPASFNAAIQFLGNIRDEFQIVIVINNTEADGRDVSWISEVNFNQLSGKNIKRIFVSGTKSSDVVSALVASGIHNDLIIEENDPDKLYSMVLAQQIKTIWLPNYSAMWKFLQKYKR